MFCFRQILIVTLCVLQCHFSPRHDKACIASPVRNIGAANNGPARTTCTDHDWWCSLVGKCSKPTMSLLCGVAAACNRKRSTAVKVSTV